VSEQKVETYETEELNVAAFFAFKKVKMLGYEHKNRKVCFTFDDSDGKCRGLHVDFINSEFKVYDGHVRDLKKLFHNNKK